MKSRWRDEDAQKVGSDPLGLRVYTSRLLGAEPALVLHGGGNTSVKTKVNNLFGEEEDVLYVKGSGWDLATIEAQGFPAVRMDVLLKLVQLPALSDTDMVKTQMAAMLDPTSPAPSVEAILHAILPFQYVDHSHADALITISNSLNGEQSIRDLYGDRLLIIPYVMPGFLLAKAVADRLQQVDWSKVEGMMLLNHGLFTFGNDAKTSYERTIALVTLAEQYLEQHAKAPLALATAAAQDLLALARIRKAVSKVQQRPLVVKSNRSELAVGFSGLPKVDALLSKGTLTPDHVIRTKPKPLILSQHPESDVDAYAQAYRDYFARNAQPGLQCLSPAPCWAVWPSQGTMAFGTNWKEASIVADINRQTMQAMQLAEQLGGWQALTEADLFEVEYWELEQAKLKKSASVPPLQGKIALVTGAYSGIGRAIANRLHQQGAEVVGVDLEPGIIAAFTQAGMLGLVADLTHPAELQQAIAAAAGHFGGLDILVLNAGVFPPSETLRDQQSDTWDRSLAVNLTAHQQMLKAAIPFLELGVEPAVLFIASKNVPAPGPGVAAYSVAKAGMTQLARVAALELGPLGIPVQILHPNAVFDTAIWTDEILQARAIHYGLSVEEYKTNNLLKIEITSDDVAQMACTLVQGPFRKCTGNQIAIDGGNDRVV